MAEKPPSIDKEQGQWFIPSAYRGPDARSNAAQRAKGHFHALAFDIDRGSPSLEAVVAAVGKMLGEVQCLIYATRSAKPEALKWRGLVPLAQPLTGAEYSAAQAALFDGLEYAGLEPDRTLERTAQLIYLPNRGEHYEHREVQGGLLDAQAHPLWKRAASYMELQEAVSSGQARAEGPRSHLAAFRRKHSIAELLALYGYVQKGNSDHWRSPYQDSGSYATQDRGDHWISLSESDAEAKLGRATPSGARYGDAFDLYVHFQHGGNYQMAESYARECLKEEDDARYGDATVEHGREIWESLTHIEGVSKAALMGTTALFQFHRGSSMEETVRMEYYIDPWLPKGIVVGVYGRGSSGKSTWVSTIVAKVGAQVSTLWISSEEYPANISKRYTETGGDPDALLVLTHMPKLNGSEKVATFNVHEHLERAITDAKATLHPSRPLGVVVLDAIGTLVTWGKGENANDDGSVKRLIAHLQSLAERHGVTIVMLGHYRKNSSSPHAADQVMGAAAWTTSLRLAFACSKDTGSEGDYDFYIKSVKNNLGPECACTYTTVSVYTLHERADGPNDVLCKVEITSDIAWGGKAIYELIPEDDPNSKAKAQRKSKEQARVDLIAEAIKAGHRTRQEIIAYAATVGVKLYGYHFTAQCDEALRARGIRIEAQAHNKLLYIA